MSLTLAEALGSVTTLTGSVTRSVLVLTFPQTDGTLQDVTFTTATVD